MLKRVFAWIILIGFILLMANILVIGYQRGISVLVYVVIVMIFLAINMKDKRT